MDDDGAEAILIAITLFALVALPFVIVYLIRN